MSKPKARPRQTLAQARHEAFVAGRADGIDAFFDRDGPCYECETIQWELACRWCRDLLCLHCAAHAHACSDKRLDALLTRPDTVILIQTEEDGEE